MLGSISYSHVPIDKRKKLDPHTSKIIFTGYGESFGVKKHTNYVIDIRTSFSLADQPYLMKLVYLRNENNIRYVTLKKI